jgi:hypothetical protein
VIVARPLNRERVRAFHARQRELMASARRPWARVEAAASRLMRGQCRRARRKLFGVSAKSRFTSEQARAAGERIGIEWATSPFDVEQLRMGMDVELEHGTHDPDTNVTDDDETVTAKIARAHLNEFPDYYTRLAAMEAEAEAYWAAHGR